MRKNTSLLLVLVFLASLAMSGCGETISGIGKDASRIGKGVKTIFIKQN